MFQQRDKSKEEKEENEHKEHSEMDMNHSSSGDVPEGLKAAENPTYEVGSQGLSNQVIWKA